MTIFVDTVSCRAEESFPWNRFYCITDVTLINNLTIKTCSMIKIFQRLIMRLTVNFRSSTS